MRASCFWLQQIVRARVAPSRERDALLAATPSELAARLTSGGLEVEALTPFGSASGRVVLARVRAVEPHPARAKLRLVTVELGGGELVRIVCGAPNVPDPAEDVLVAFAPVGTHVPGLGVTLEPKDIGGVVSAGMLCSERELGLSSSGEGIVIFTGLAARPGDTLASVIPESADTVLEIGLTPNRPDGLGHLGLARELAALYGATLLPAAEDLALPTRGTSGVTLSTEPAKHVSVELRDTERCPRYGAALLEGVTIDRSPPWARYRLEALGVRPISNVVDVTNLAMLLYGHPMHAFDVESVRGGRIVVRRAAAGERLRTLDGAERSLDADDLVIADAEGPTALAGVMGGEGSEIRPTTSRVLLECAWFWPRGVRRASRRHGLHTESSHRFERGVDPAGVPEVLACAARWILSGLASSEPAAGDASASAPSTSAASSAALVALGQMAPPSWMVLAGDPVVEPAPIVLRERKVASLLGAHVPLADALALLERLGAKASPVREAALGPEATVVPPTHRPDLSMEADLIEEVMRVRGLESLAPALPRLRPGSGEVAPVTEVSRRLRRAAIEVGLSEAVTFAFVSPRELEALAAPSAVVRVINPLTVERSVLRTSLLPGLLEALARARRHGVRDVRLFTAGSVFVGPVGEAGLPAERPVLAVVLAGERGAPLERPRPIDAWDAKGVAVELAERALRASAVGRPLPAAERPAHLHPRAAGEVVVLGRRVGTFGALHPDVVEALDLGGEAFVVELALDELASLGVRTPRFAPIPTLPASSRDIALVVHDDVPAAQVESAIREAAGELCESVRPFDLFRGGSIPADHRSLAFRLVYRDPRAATKPADARTLSDAEVDERHAAVLQAVGARFGARLRGEETAGGAST